MQVRFLDLDWRIRGSEPWTDTTSSSRGVDSPTLFSFTKKGSAAERSSCLNLGVAEPVLPVHPVPLRTLADRNEKREGGMKAFAIRVLVATVLTFSLCAARAADTIKVAFLGSLSGPFALQGEETLKNVEAAADIVNSRGGVLGGKKFEIVPFDNKGNPQESLIVLKQAIDQDMRYIISGVSNIAHAITDAVGKHNARNTDRPVLFLDYGALDPALTEA